MRRTARNKSVHWKNVALLACAVLFVTLAGVLFWPRLHGAHDKYKGSCYCSAEPYCLCTPSLAIDALIMSCEGAQSKILLVKRRAKPFGLALPGGFVEVGESVESAVEREVMEETSLELQTMELHQIYSDPQRDPRRHTVSVVYACTAKNPSDVTAGDDASDAVWIAMDEVESRTLAFDHSKIIVEYLAAHPNGVCS